MGYTTDFIGVLKLNRQLTVDESNFLKKLNQTRRMARNVDAKYGVEGEFYVDGGYNDYNDPTVIDHNVPPKTQPGLWCQWVPTEDGMGIEWDGGEKFYSYVEWLEYIINSVFPYITKEGDEPLVLNGEIEWFGEDNDDTGVIIVDDNVVTTRARGESGESATRVFFVTDGPVDGDNFQHEELHETLEAAEEHAEYMTNPRIRVCMVKNAYRETDGTWNYDDQIDTFETIKTIKD